MQENEKRWNVISERKSNIIFITVTEKEIAVAFEACIHYLPLHIQLPLKSTRILYSYFCRTLLASSASYMLAEITHMVAVI